jgi:fatty-acyl-CoA synthase
VDVRETARLVARAPVLAARAGILTPPRPWRAPQLLGALRHGAGVSGLVALNAARYPDAPAVIDEDGTTTFAELDERAARIAGGLRSVAGGDGGRTLAIMCRNHRGLVEALVAGSRLGWRLLLVNYELQPRQLAQVLEREGPHVLVHDSELEDRLGEVDERIARVLADGDLGRDCAPAPPSRREGGIVLLTSGTTGLPKGAPRETSARDAQFALGLFTTVLDRTSIRAREPVLVGPPGFHAFGLGAIALGLGLGGGAILRRRFDAEAALAAIERQRAGVAMFVPVMLERILALPEDVRRRYDVSSARTVITGAAPLLPSLQKAFTAEFGDVLHNGYGTTEVGLGAFATPRDLREAPGTIGRPVDGIPVKVLDEDGREQPPGEVGGLYVGGLVLKGYSGGGELAAQVDGMLNTGDLAHMDAAGRLFIDGRQDDMIVSGGENVFPGEVEDVLASHSEVADVAVVGVPDERFGQRLVAFVVRAPGGEVDADALIAHVRDNLERYKVPRDVTFVDEIPRNPTGKILRRELVGE